MNLRLLLASLVGCLALQAQYTTITGPINTPTGGTFSGRITITPPNFVNAVPVMSNPYTVTAGSFSINLLPNDANRVVTGQKNAYTVSYRSSSGVTWTECWVVPTSAFSLTVPMVKTGCSILPDPVSIMLTQIQSGGATTGQALTWSGTSWQPGNLSGVSVSSFNSRTGAVVPVSGDYTTAMVTESGNLFFTEARARAAMGTPLSPIEYNSSTGAFSCPTCVTSSALTSALTTKANAIHSHTAADVSGTFGSGQVPLGPGLLNTGSAIAVEDARQVQWYPSTTTPTAGTNGTIAIETTNGLPYIYANAMKRLALYSEVPTGAELQSNKNVAGGYAGLNGSSLLSTAQMGTGTRDSSTVLHGDGVFRAVTVSQPVGVTSASGTLDFGAIAAGRYSEALTFPATGYPAGVPVSVNQPLAGSGYFATARINENNVASVYLYNANATNGDPASASFTVSTGTENASGPTLPATCRVGETFIDTDATPGSNFYACIAPNVWQLQAGGGSGSGDVSGPASSVDSEIALFSGTGGKTIKRATQTGVLKAASGVISVVSGTASDCVKVDGSSGACGSGGTTTTHEEVWNAVSGGTTLYPLILYPTSGAPTTARYGTTPWQIAAVTMPDSSETSFTWLTSLHAGYTTGGTLQVNWLANTSNTQDVRFYVTYACSSVGDAIPGTESSQIIIDAANGGSNVRNATSFSLPMTGCAAGDAVLVRLGRLGAATEDTLTVSAGVFQLKFSYTRNL